MTDDLVMRLRTRSLAFADDLDADAADRIEQLEAALQEIGEVASRSSTKSVLALRITDIARAALEEKEDPGSKE